MGGGRDRRAARRFSISTPLFYRVWNKTDWHHGTTENISTAGILFQSDVSSEPGVRLEIGFVLPSALREESGARVACSSEVVRCENPRGSGVRYTLAVRILFSQMQPWKDAPGGTFGRQG
jgi:hypothetical protein